MRLVDADRVKKTNCTGPLKSKIDEWIDSQPTIEAIPKDQYEARLKADMVTILNKIRAEITENIEFNIKMNYMGIVSGLALANDVIDKYNAEIEPQESENKE